MVIERVTSDYSKILIGTIGSQLLKLRYFNCDDIDASAELLPTCLKVEKLYISGGLNGTKTFTTSCRVAHTKVLIVFCLALSNSIVMFVCVVSHLFESPRPLFTRFVSCCLHICILESNSRCTLTDIHKLWPNLATLVIHQFNKSLKMEQVRQIMQYVISQFSELWFVSWPLPRR